MPVCVASVATTAVIAMLMAASDANGIVPPADQTAPSFTSASARCVGVVEDRCRRRPACR